MTRLCIKTVMLIGICLTSSTIALGESVTVAVPVTVPIEVPSEVPIADPTTEMTAGDTVTGSTTPKSRRVNQTHELVTVPVGIKKCRKMTGANKEDMEIFMDEDVPYTTEGRCFVHCLFVNAAKFKSKSFRVQLNRYRQRTKFDRVTKTLKCRKPGSEAASALLQNGSSS